MADERFERAQEDAAAHDAGAIGGPGSGEDLDPAERPVAEAGGGVAEGFEQAEDELIEHASHGDQHASHGDQHAARRVVDQAGEPEEAAEPDGAAEDAEADHEHSSERADADR